MDKMDYWRLCDELSVYQAALLVIGVDPADYPYMMNYAEHEMIDNFPAVLAALSHAILSQRLPATRINTDDREWDKLDINKTTLLVEDLRVWLKERGFKAGFFFPESEDAPSYLDKNHKNFAPKLAVAIEAWETVNANPDLLKGRTVKQALLKWLQENANRFGLTKDDGSPNEQGIEEIAKIANWDSKGGAPKTPE